jgi:hypothetical protein
VKSEVVPGKGWRLIGYAFSLSGILCLRWLSTRQENIHQQSRWIRFAIGVLSPVGNDDIFGIVAFVSRQNESVC